MNIQVIYSNKWVSLVQAELDNGSRYMYTHEPWCSSLGVAVLPYRQVDGQTEYLGRYEVCPAHSDRVELCAITGGHDVKGESFHDTARRELQEEAGYSVSLIRMEQLGNVRPSKASDKTVHLYAVDVTNMEQGEAHGDGTLGEEGAYTKWVSKHKAIFSKDPVLTTMITRLGMLRES